MNTTSALFYIFSAVLLLILGLFLLLLILILILLLLSNLVKAMISLL